MMSAVSPEPPGPSDARAEPMTPELPMKSARTRSNVRCGAERGAKRIMDFSTKTRGCRWTLVIGPRPLRGGDAARRKIFQRVNRDQLKKTKLQRMAVRCLCPRFIHRTVGSHPN